MSVTGLPPYGQIDIQHHGGIARARSRGDILLRCSSPLDDLVVGA